MNIPEILVANGTGAVLVSFLLLLRVRGEGKNSVGTEPVSYTHLRAHET